MAQATALKIGRWVEVVEDRRDGLGRVVVPRGARGMLAWEDDERPGWWLVRIPPQLRVWPVPASALRSCRRRAPGRLDLARLALVVRAVRLCLRNPDQLTPELQEGVLALTSVYDFVCGYRPDCHFVEQFLGHWPGHCRACCSTGMCAACEKQESADCAACGGTRICSLCPPSVAGEKPELDLLNLLEIGGRPGSERLRYHEQAGRMVPARRRARRGRTAADRDALADAA